MDFSIAAIRSGLVVIYDISPKALGPTRGLSAVLGRNALEWPGDCDAARRELNGPKARESQDPDRRECASVWFALRSKPSRVESKCCHHEAKDHNDSRRKIRQPLRNPIKPGPSSAGFLRCPRRCHADGNQRRGKTNTKCGHHRDPQRELFYLNANKQDSNRRRTWQQPTGEPEPDNFSCTRASFWARVIMSMIVAVWMTILIVMVLMAGRPQAQKHAHGKQCHQDP